MAIDLKQTAIDPDIAIPPTRNTKEALRAALDDLQGNILKSHGRDHSHFLIITFKTDTPEIRTKARQWLAGLVAADRVTSALQQWEEAQSYREVQETILGNGAMSRKDVDALVKAASMTFVGVMLSADGYRALKLDKNQIPDDPSFLAGAKTRVDVLNDPPVEHWELAYQSNVHALVVVADDATDRLDTLVAKLKGELKDLCVMIAEETGTAMRLDANGNEDPLAPVREHFGFVDGISQPLFYARDIEKARTLQGGIDQYDPSAPLDQVLVKDPGGKDNGYGSYFVYRKLQQDVNGFHDDEKRLAKKIAEHAHPKTPAPTPEDVALAGAYMVGRFQDGTPVVDRGVTGLGSLPNNFTFDADPDGVRCPFQAHIRKTNPRGDKQRQFGQPLTQERTQRIARRAISYGKVTLNADKGDEVGLLFLCAQSSIPDQFEFIQNQWANNKNFLRGGSGLDPVIGQLYPDQPDDGTLAGHWPKLYGSRNELDFSTNPPSVVGHTFAERIGQWVTMKGGEYFFVPSLSALKAYGDVKE
ncbi:Dyp-type peroxidase [Streptomyces sp. NPDC086549]|uniref:Dyp-type peroxidase n=1 Tax=Streptomyces sp. NPDC086549 TaxID=3365752 RepID=UPI00382341B4